MSGEHYNYNKIAPYAAESDVPMTMEFLRRNRNPVAPNPNDPGFAAGEDQGARVWSAQWATAQ